MPFSSIVRTSDFIYTCLSTREMAECVFMYFFFNLLKPEEGQGRRKSNIE